MNDRLTKAFLAAIALGLWANAVIPLVRPAPARAGAGDIEGILSDIAVNTVTIDSRLKDIRDDLQTVDRTLRGVGRVRCLNPKVCVDAGPAKSK